MEQSIATAATAGVTTAGVATGSGLTLDPVAPHGAGRADAFDLRAPAEEAPGADDPLALLAERLELRTATVAVVGLGYVGLPLLVAAGDGASTCSASTPTPHKIGRCGAASRTSSTSDARRSRRAAWRSCRPTTRSRSRRPTSSSSRCRRRSTTAPPTCRSSSARWPTSPRRCARAARRARVDDVPGHDRGAAAPDPRGVGPASRASTSSSATRPSASTRATRRGPSRTRPEDRVGRRPGVADRARRRLSTAQLVCEGRAGAVARARPSW